jgi:Protein of unknown function (DUF3558)
VNRRFAVLPLLAACALTLAACNNSTPGSAIGGSGSQGGSATSGDSSPSSTTTASGTQSLQPCNLLTASDLARYGLHKTDSGTALGARTCNWQNVTTNGGAGYAVGVDIRDNQGVSTANTQGYTVTTVTLGTHHGVQLASPGACVVILGVTNTSRVDIGGNDGYANQDQSCAEANNIANLVEPKLPAGN